MKLVKKINPKNLFKSKKHNSNSSLSRSQPSSFDSSTSSNGSTTPTSVLQNNLSTSSYDIIRQLEDGKISRSELESVLLKISPSSSSSSSEEEEVNLMIDDKELGFVFGQPLSEDELKDAFEFFDTDGDGIITPQELFHVFKTIGDGQCCTLEDCKRMIAGVDKNGDGFVCFQDFALMMEMQR